MKASEGEHEVFKCMCHNSEYDPRHAAQVVFGPAPRRLAALPLAIVDGALVVAGTFIGKVGAQQG
jgi:Rieske Fe-S protein